LDPLTAKPSALYLPVELFEGMRSDVNAKHPIEACGFVAGKIENDGYHALEVIPMTNIFDSPTRYRMDPQEQWNAFKYIEEKGWELVGIYHSHSAGPPGPSATDIAEAYYPESIYLIWSPSEAEWVCRCFLIQDNQVDQIELFIEP